VTKNRLGINAKGRRIEEQQDELFVLREESAPYNAVFDTENEALSTQNAFFLDDSLMDLDG
jgi:hypothetical protein